jgi:N-acetylmuramoyl-L-alanine amidase
MLGLAAALSLAVPATANAAFAHVVAPGESLYSVAAADGLSVSQLAAENGLSPDSQLISGSTLLIPPQTSSTVAAPSTMSTTTSASPSEDTTGTDAGETGEGTSTSVATGYLVQPGDTLSAIAARDGVSVDQLAAANGLDPNGVLLSGSSLSLPTASSTAVPVSTTPTNSDPAVASAESTGGPYPTAETVSSSEVASIGSATGVPGSLADAVGWQESGFNNGLVSSTGAVGVMQIEPGTWDWIQRTLTAGTPLNPSSAADNVRAGSLYLHSLINSTGSLSMAAASYYQGLASVQSHGMYSDTQQYVNSVMSLFQHYGGG